MSVEQGIEPNIEEADVTVPHSHDFTKDPRDEADVATLGDALSNEGPMPEERSYVFETRVERANELWEVGKVKFRDNDIPGALKAFETGLYHLDFDELSYNFELLDQHRASVEKVRIPLWLNVAACLIREKRPKEAIEHCDRVLKQEPVHVKALFRRGRAREEMGDLELAMEDFTKARSLSKDDAEIVRAIASVQKRLNEAQKTVDDLWRGKIKLPPLSASSKTSESSENVFVRFFHWLTALFLSVLAMLRGRTKTKTA